MRREPVTQRSGRRLQLRISSHSRGGRVQLFGFTVRGWSSRWWLRAPLSVAAASQAVATQVTSGIGWLGVRRAPRQYGLTPCLFGGLRCGPHLRRRHFDPAVTLGLGRRRRLPGNKVIVSSSLRWPRHLRQRRALRDRLGQGRLLALRRLRRQRLRRPPPAGYQPARRDRHRDAPHRRLPARHPRGHRQKGPGRARAAGHRPGADPDPPDLHPGDEHVREPRPKRRPALFVGDWALAQLWVFIVFPIIGGLVGGSSTGTCSRSPSPRGRSRARVESGRRGGGGCTEVDPGDAWRARPAGTTSPGRPLTSSVSAPLEGRAGSPGAFAVRYTLPMLADHLTDWIHAQVTASGGAGAVFGLSGGIDSAVVAALAKARLSAPHPRRGHALPQRPAGRGGRHAGGPPLRHAHLDRRPGDRLRRAPRTARRRAARTWA